MKRNDLIKHIIEYGCVFEREGKKHTLYYNPKTRNSATIPRHREINTYTAREICRDLNIPIVKGK